MSRIEKTSITHTTSPQHSPRSKGSAPEGMRTAGHLAGSSSVTGRTVAHGTDVRGQALHDAIRHESLKEVKDWLSQGTEGINYQNEKGNTAMHLLAKRVGAGNHMADHARLLAESGADLGLKNKKGLTPMDILSKNESHAMVDHLKPFVKDVDATGAVNKVKGETTAVHLAVKNSKVNDIHVLLTGIKPSYTDDKHKYTKNMAKYLNQPDVDGRTAFKIAEDNHRNDIVAMLKRYERGDNPEDIRNGR